MFFEYFLFTIISIIFALLCTFFSFVKNLSDKTTHFIEGVAVGFFISMSFIILLPETIKAAKEEDYNTTWICSYIFLGFLFILFVNIVEKSMYSTDSDDMKDIICGKNDEAYVKSRTIPLQVFIGLTIHAATDGISMGLLLFSSGENQLNILAITAFLIHKLIEILTFSVVFMNEEKESMVDVYFYIFSFTLTTPLFALIPLIIHVKISEFIPLAFATGIILSVGIYHRLAGYLYVSYNKGFSGFLSYGYIIYGTIVIIIVKLLLDSSGL